MPAAVLPRAAGWLPKSVLLVTVEMQLFRRQTGNVLVQMRSFLQDELAGLKSRWLRLLALLTCLALTFVAAEQQRAIEAQTGLIASLSAESNKAKIEGKSEPRVSVYITDSKILEPASKAPDAPPPARQTSPARFQHQI